MQKNKNARAIIWPILISITLLALIGSATTWFGSHEAPEAQHNEQHEEAGHPLSTEISDESAQIMGVETTQAKASIIRQTVQLSGRVMLNQNRSSAVKARFPGIVRSVVKQVGDTVKRGDKLATVESNESLQTYTVPSPLDGIIVERNISVGDTAADAPIFMVADLRSLWVEFYVFASDMGAIRNGQTVLIHTLDGKTRTKGLLNTIQPTAEASSQTITARTEIDNSSGEWRAGMTVQGDVITSETAVEIAVPTAAIQKMEGTDVVFVKQGTIYTAIPVTLGITDREMTHITAGLAAGTEIVSRNSFIVKADIGKTSAEHEH